MFFFPKNLFFDSVYWYSQMNFDLRELEGGQKQCREAAGTARGGMYELIRAPLVLQETKLRTKFGSGGSGSASASASASASGSASGKRR
jgi:hypothetical protein